MFTELFLKVVVRPTLLDCARCWVAVPHPGNEPAPNGLTDIGIVHKIVAEEECRTLQVVVDSRRLLIVLYCVIEGVILV